MNQHHRVLVGVAAGLVVVAAYAASRPASGPGLPDDESPAEPEVPADGTTALPLGPGVGAPPMSTSLTRTDVPIGSSVDASFAESVFSVDELDAIFIERLDIYAQLPSGSTVSFWTDDAGELRAVKLAPKHRTSVGAFRYDGPHAEPGWYDQHGRSLRSGILARPVRLSRITSGFGVRHHPLTDKTRMHRGIDYGARTSEPVRCVADGEVVEAGEAPGPGRYVVVKHATLEYTSRYFHLLDFTVKAGQRVTKGQVIGRVGQTGAATGPHLHYELTGSAGFQFDASNHRFPGPTALGPAARIASKELSRLLQ